MKMRTRLTAVLLISIITIVVFTSCIPDAQLAVGTAVLHVSIAGYTEEGEKSVVFDLRSVNQGKSAARSVPLDSDDSASAYFTSLDPDTWEATVQLLNGDSVVGSHTFSFDVFADETTTSRIDGVYAEGELTFTVETADSETEPAVSIDEIRGTLFESRRYWDDSASAPEQFVRINAAGDLQSLESCTVVYPDSYRFSIGPDSRAPLVFTFEQWSDSSSGENGFYLDRYNYFETGTVFTSAYDINGLGDSATYSFGIDSEGISGPAVTQPAHNSLMSVATPIDITWNYSENFEVAQTLIFVVRDNDVTFLDFSTTVGDTGTNTVSIPSFTLQSAILYRLIVIGIDESIVPPNQSNPNNELLGFTDSGNYDYNTIIERLYLSDEPLLEFIGSARLYFDATP